MRANWLTKLTVVATALLLCAAMALAGFCPECGKKVPDKAKFCPECGAKMAPADTPAEKGDGKLETPPDPGLPDEPVKPATVPDKPAVEKPATDPATPATLAQRLKGKRYFFLVYGGVNGNEIGTADQEVATGRLTDRVDRGIKKILGGSVYDGDLLAKVRQDKESMQLLTGGGAAEVKAVLAKYNTDFLVRIRYRTAPVAKVGAQFSATASVSAEILCQREGDRPFSVSSPVMGTDDHPAKMAMGAFDAAMLALDYSVDQTLEALQDAVAAPPAPAVATTPRPAAGVPLAVRPLSTAEAAAILKGRKPRVAVFKFDNQAGHDYDSWNLPEGLADMLITELMNAGKVKVYERKELDAILQEKDLQTATGARGAQGQVVGVEYLIKGTITEYAYKSKDSGGGLGFGGVKLGLNSSTANVALDLRIIDAGTGEVLASKRVEKKNKTTGVGLGANIKGVSFGGDSWSKTPIGKTTREAITDASVQVLQIFDGLPWKSVILAEDAPSGGFLIRGGQDQGLRPGMSFKVIRKNQDLTDPETGEKLGSSATEVGVVVVQEVHEKVSLVLLAGGGPAKRGDMVVCETAPAPALPPPTELPREGKKPKKEKPRSEEE